MPWQSFSILNFGFGIVSDFLQYINPWHGPQHPCSDSPDAQQQLAVNVMMMTDGNLLRRSPLSF
jgi:hypothetical protein